LICRKLSFAIIYDTTPSADYTGHRVLKAFGAELYSCHVQSSYYEADEAERNIWTVIYEDNDVEDYYTDELLEIILPAGLFDLYLSAAWHPLKSKYDQRIPSTWAPRG
jgi:hypothetical protein